MFIIIIIIWYKTGLLVDLTIMARTAIRWGDLRTAHLERAYVAEIVGGNLGHDARQHGHDAVADRSRRKCARQPLLWKTCCLGWVGVYSCHA